MTTIVGAGLAGLSAAYHLRSDYTILERDAEVGGMCKSIMIDGYTFDYAPHILFTKDQYVKDFFFKMLGKNIHTNNRKAYIYMEDTYVKYPFEANLYPLPEKIKEECIKGVLERPDLEPKNFLEWIKTTMGEGIAKHYMVPYNEKVWKYPLKCINTEWIIGRIPAPSVDEMRLGANCLQPLDYGPNAEFWYPKNGGVGALAESISKNVAVKLNAEVKYFGSSSTGVETFYIEGGKERVLKSDNVLSSLPLPEIINMMDGVPEFVISAADKLVYNSLVCVMIGVKRPQITDKHWIYFPENDIIFNRISFPMNFSSNTTPSGKSSIIVEITYRNQPIDIKKIKKKVIQDLIKTNIIFEEDEIDVCEAKDFKYAYVVYDLEHKKNIKVIHDFIIAHNIIPIGRFGEWEYFNMDKTILSGKNAAEKIK